MASDIKLFNMDCMTALREMEDNQFDLAIVDPPYGLGDRLKNGGDAKPNLMKKLYAETEWEDVAPSHDYFKELVRVSKNQIIWGANYFGLQPTRGFVVWDKVKFASNYSQCEYAWTSFDCIARIFKFCSNGGFVVKQEDSKIHPTQKPVSLYRWILENYAEKGQAILDTHLGSGSIAVACWDLGFDLCGYELNKNYYAAALNRLEAHKKQGQFAFD